VSKSNKPDPARCGQFLHALAAGLPHGYALAVAGLKWRDVSLELARSADLTLLYAQALNQQRAVMQRRRRKPRQ
jgi:hypothetical protein